MMTTNLFVIANVKQLRTDSSFRILLPFFQTSWGVGVLNSANFNRFHNRVEFGTILEGLRNLEGGGLNPPPKPPLGTPQLMTSIRTVCRFKQWVSATKEIDHHQILLLLVQHRATMKSFQALRSPAIPLTSFHDLLLFLISSSIALRHVKEVDKLKKEMSCKWSTELKLQVRVVFVETPLVSGCRKNVSPSPQLAHYVTSTRRL